LARVPQSTCVAVRRLEPAWQQLPGGVAMLNHAMTAERDKAARDILAFYLEAGVDGVLVEEPVDRFAEPAPAPRAERAAVAPAAREAKPAPRLDRAPPPLPGTAAPPPPDQAMMAAREAAGAAKDLDELRAILERFEGCALRNTATQLVFSAGNPQARVMLVGEAPGRDEDIEGQPFVGRSGKLLDRMLAAIGLDRSQVYIANVIPWRPPGNRTPTPQESQICLPFIRRQIELANPDILVCMGNPATQTLLEVREGITRTRGRWFKYDTGAREIRAIPTLHPAYLLRQPLSKRLAWRDFLAVKKALG
jgi:uracil-DNA glycosylase